MPRDRERYNAWMREWRRTNPKPSQATRTYAQPDKDGVTQDYLRAILSYDKETGQFCWVMPNCMRLRAGDAAGNLNPTTGYVHISILGRKYAAHRLAWLYVTGAWPSGDIDHINGARADNKWQNLRDVTTSVNCQNRRAAHAQNSSGRLGVSWHKRQKQFKASIWVDAKNLHLGYFDDPDEAHAVYLEAKRRLHEGSTL